MAIVLKNDGIDLEYCKTGSSIYGAICIESDGLCFPDRQWTDFIYPVTDWWADELLGCCKNKQMEFMFMDGSYIMRGRVIEGNLELTCCKDSRCNGNELKKITCSMSDFKSDLMNALSDCQSIFLENGNRKLSERCFKQVKLLSDLQIHF